MKAFSFAFLAIDGKIMISFRFGWHSANRVCFFKVGGAQRLHMQTWTIIWTEGADIAWKYWRCQAGNSEQAEEKFEAAHPEGDLLWVNEGGSIAMSLDDEAGETAHGTDLGLMEDSNNDSPKEDALPVIHQISDDQPQSDAKQKLVERLTGDPQRPLLHFHVEPGTGQPTEEELCNEILRALDQAIAAAEARETAETFVEDSQLVDVRTLFGIT